MAEKNLDTGDIIPPTPLSGEDDEGEVPGLGTGSSDDTIPKPSPVPEFDEIGEEEDLKGVTDRGGVPAFGRASDFEQTSGAGNVEDRGTTTGYGVVDEGDTGTGALGMEGTESTDQRSTEPLSDQGPVTGVDEE
ncbi:MAG: hypothetical protein M3220_04885 [Chloroflexota bacterium]|nr:hypothetical protein [Chloroflexota bacterium]